MKKLLAFVCVLFIGLSFGCANITSNIETDATEFQKISGPKEIPSDMEQVNISYKCIIDDNPIIAPLFYNTDNNCYYFYFENNFVKITDTDGNPLDFETIDAYSSYKE